MPTIAVDLHASPAASVWVINAYQLAMVATILPFAALGEILGYRRVYIAGLVVFTGASLVCALSWSLPSLAIARVLQGLGASGIMCVNTALIRFIYPARLLGTGMGNNALVVGVAFAVGPTVASGILSVADWPWLFAVNVPLGIFAVAIALYALPPTPRTPARFDLASALLSAATFGLYVFTLGEASQGAPRGRTLASLAVLLVCAAWLVRRQLPLRAPMLPIDLYRRPVFALSSLTALCSFAAQGLAFVALPFYFQTTLGRSQVDTGLLMTPWPVVVAILAPIAGRLSDRLAPAILGGWGMIGLTTGLLLLAFLPPHPSVADIVWRMAVCGGGFGFFQSPNLRALMASAPPERSGGASTGASLDFGGGGGMLSVERGISEVAPPLGARREVGSSTIPRAASTPHSPMGAASITAIAIAPSAIRYAAP